MKVRYAVTFEFDTKAPMTHRGTIAASQVPTCFARAVRDAKKALRPGSWSSCVCVLLERLSDDTAEKESVTPMCTSEKGPDSLNVSEAPEPSA